MNNIQSQPGQISDSVIHALAYIFAGVMLMTSCMLGFAQLFQSQLG